MTFNNWMDAIGGVGFLLALGILFSVRVQKDGLFTTGVKSVMLGFLAIYVYTTLPDFLGYAHLSDLADLFKDYVQVLPAVVAVGAVYMLYSNQQLQDMTHAHRALQQSHDLMMDVVDEAPSGILLLDTAGRIAFANETAKSILDLEEDADVGKVRGPGWVARGHGASEPDTLPALVGEHSYRGREIRLDWPSGWFVELRASGKPLSDSQDRLGGVVVMFEKA